MGTQEQEEVRTLFVSGLPNDTKPREVYLLFRAYKGYQGSFLKLISSRPGKSPQPIAFVSFATRKQAEFALKDLHGIRFDPANPQTLRLEYARSNSRLQPNQPVQGAPPPTVASSATVNATPSRHQPPMSFQPNVNGVYGVYMMPNVALQQFAHQQDIVPSPNPRLYDIWSDSLQIPVPFQGASRLSTPSPTFDLSPASAHLSVLNILSDSDSSYMYNPQEYHHGYPTMTPSSPSTAKRDAGPNVDVRASGMAPSSTLVVSNLEPHHTEEEVKTLFASCEGVVNIHVKGSKGDPPVAFVNFKDAACASQAMEKLQGHVLPSSLQKKSPGIKIEFTGQWTREVQSPTSSDSAESNNSSSPPASVGSASVSTKSSTNSSPSPQAVPFSIGNGSLNSIALHINSDSSRPSSQQPNTIIPPNSMRSMLGTVPTSAPPNSCTHNGMYTYNAPPFSLMYPGGYKPPQIFMNNFPSSTCMSTNLL